jgi:hypothetical protein
MIAAAWRRGWRGRAPVGCTGYHFARGVRTDGSPPHAIATHDWRAFGAEDVLIASRGRQRRIAGEGLRNCVRHL